MEELLPEMAAEIAQYLTVKELAICCQVSKTMRELFGSDQVWRSRCDVDMEEYLRTTPCRVEPKMRSLEPETSTLQTAGRWRAACMREAHLWKNWEHGRCVKEEIGISQGQVFFLNNFVITFTNSFMYMQLIDTNEVPAVCVAELAVAAEGSFVRQMFQVQNDKILTVADDNTVKVIKVDLEFYSLSVENSFRLDKGTNDVKIVNTVLVGVKAESLHIWDWQRRTKLKTDNCPFDLPILYLLNHDAKCENLGVVGMVRAGYFLYIYSLKDLKFWEFMTIFPELECFAIVDQYVALGIGFFYLEIYNYHTCECLHTIRFDNSIVYAMGNSFMFINFNHELVKLSPATGIITYIDPNVNCPLHPNDPTDNSLLIGLNEKLFKVTSRCSRCNVVGKLWKITPTTASSVPLPTHLFEGCCPRPIVNEACSKTVVEMTQNCQNVLYNFW